MIDKLKYKDITEKIITMKKKSVQSDNPFKSVIQIISDIVKAHGGQLKVETINGGGSLFFIMLPV